jgi:hypothetical protein
MKWFQQVLFNPEENSLPIFGSLMIKKSESPPSEPKVRSVQRYLINEYLSPKKPHEKVIQVSLALICYWYQKFNPHLFFGSEKEYWKEMIESLGIILNFHDSYSLKKLDDEGNFNGL